MNQAAINFRVKVAHAFEKSHFGSYRKASLAAQMSAPQVQQIIQGRFDNSTTGPGIFAMQRLAKALDVPVGHLLDDDSIDAPKDPGVLNGTAGHGPSLDAFTQAHWQGGGQLAAFAHLKEYFDLYRLPPSAQASPQIEKIGRQTLLALRLRTTSASKAQAEFDMLPEEKRANITDFHRQVAQSGIALDNVFFDHRLRTQPVHVRAGYSRLGALVSDPEGQQLVLIYCRPIPV